MIKFILPVRAFFVLAFLAPGFVKAQDTTGGGFGDSIPISNGFMGRVYLLKAGTDSLPLFDTMKPAGMPLYAPELNIADRDWSTGFPGLQNRFEWFGLDYTGEFRVTRNGNYVFRLVSDDGARLYVGHRLLIDEDGTHPVSSGSAMITLSQDSNYAIEVRYYQGPRFRLALQLFWTKAGDSVEQVFPGPAIVLHPGKPSAFPWWWLLLAVAIGFGIWLWNKNKR